MNFKKNRKKKGPPYVKPLIDPDLRVLNEAMGTMSVKDIYAQSFLSKSTINNLRKGKTKRPSHMTMIGIAAAQSLVWRLVKD